MARSTVSFRGAAGSSTSHSLSKSFLYIVVTLLFLGLPSAHSQLEKLYTDVTDLKILVDETYLMKLVQIGQYNTTLEVAAQIQHPDIVQFVPQTVTIPGSAEPNTTVNITHDICVLGKSPGHSEVTFNVTPSGFVNMDEVFLRITVMHSHAISVISYIMGWIYFAAWSVSFYPQIYINFKRKSVVGLNFDFLALNIMGFTMYSLFNCGLYFSKEIQTEYFSRHPRGLNPVQLNDVFFSLHAAFATLITITQCFIYERDEQRVSNTGRGILALFTVIVIVTAGLGFGGVLKWLDFLYYCSYIKLCITLIKYVPQWFALRIVRVTARLGFGGVLKWLDFLYYCSYIKLCITLIKYVPQAYMNYKRKSTVGWSIGNIFLDFVGGFLSILQMVLNAYNYNDWVSFFGDATKFGLGLFSLVFDVFFMLQHYVFYREDKSLVLESENSSDVSKSDDEQTYFLVSTGWEARYILLPGRSSCEDLEETSEDQQTSDTPYQGPPA